MDHVHLARRLVLQDPVKSPDAAGGFTIEWEDLGTIWAQLTTGSGRLSARAGGAESVGSVKAIVRAAPVNSSMRVKAGQRLVEGERCFDVLHVAELDAGGKYLRCSLREGEIT